MTSEIDLLTIRDNGIDEKLDRRVKLTPEEKERIRTQYFNLHESERPTQAALAAKYHVSRRLIQFTLYPEREDIQKERARIRRRDGRYYDREKSRLQMREYRKYKRKLVKEGKLVEGL